MNAMKTVNDATPILEEDDWCAVCEGTENLGRWDGWLTVCSSCYEGGRFKEWLIAEMESALEASEEYRRLPDGKWIRVNTTAI